MKDFDTTLHSTRTVDLKILLVFNALQIMIGTSGIHESYLGCLIIISSTNWWNFIEIWWLEVFFLWPDFDPIVTCPNQDGGLYGDCTSHLSDFSLIFAPYFDICKYWPWIHQITIRKIRYYFESILKKLLILFIVRVDGKWYLNAYDIARITLWGV